MSDISQIDGHSVRRKRESFGWAISDMATMACLSSKQIKQIEEGGLAAFYSESVKLTAARKVAGILQMTEAELFGQAPPQIHEKHLDEEEALFEPHEVSVPIEVANTSLTVAEGAPLSRSESWHFLAQPPENINEPEAQSPVEEPVIEKESEALEKSAEPAQIPEEIQPEENTEQSNNTNNLIKIIALFLVALAAAALLKQNYPDDKADSTVSKENQTPPPVMAPVPNAEPEQTGASNAQAVAPAAVNAVQMPSGATEASKPQTQPNPAAGVSQPSTDRPASASGK